MAKNKQKNKKRAAAAQRSSSEAQSTTSSIGPESPRSADAVIDSNGVGGAGNTVTGAAQPTTLSCDSHAKDGVGVPVAEVANLETAAAAAGQHADADTGENGKLANGHALAGDSMSSNRGASIESASGDAEQAKEGSHEGHVEAMEVMKRKLADAHGQVQFLVKEGAEEKHEKVKLERRVDELQRTKEELKKQVEQLVGLGDGGAAPSRASEEADSRQSVVAVAGLSDRELASQTSVQSAEEGEPSVDQLGRNEDTVTSQLQEDNTASSEAYDSSHQQIAPQMMEDLQALVEAAESRKRALEHKVEELQSEKRQLEDRVRVLNDQLQSAEANTKDLQSLMRSRDTQLEAAERELKDAAKQEATLKARINALEEELEAKVKDLADRIKAQENEREDVQMHQTGLETALEAAVASQRDAENQKALLESHVLELEGLEVKVKDLEGRVSTQEIELEDAGRHQKELESALGAAVASQKDAGNHKVTLESHIVELEGQLEAKTTEWGKSMRERKTEQEDAERQRRDLESALDAARASQRDARNDKAALESRVVELENKLEAVILSKEEEDTAGKLEALQTELEAERRWKVISEGAVKELVAANERSERQVQGCTPHGSCDLRISTAREDNSGKERGRGHAFHSHREDRYCGSPRELIRNTKWTCYVAM